MHRIVWWSATVVCVVLSYACMPGVCLSQEATFVQVLAKLRGEQELPWEGDLAEKNPATRRQLGLFRESVLALLRRDPAQRASLADFCHTANSVFSSPTTIADSGPLNL